MEDEHIRIDDLSTHLGSLFTFPRPSAFYGVQIFCILQCLISIHPSMVYLFLSTWLLFVVEILFDLQVFDGHGGPDAAAYIRKNVMRFFFEDVKFPQTSEVDPIFLEEVENSLREAFLLADLALADDGSVSSSSGTTAIAAFVFER